MRLWKFACPLFLLLAGVCLSGCATSRAANIDFEIRLGKTSPQPGWLKMAHPTEEWPIYVLPETILTADDIAEAHVVELKTPRGMRNEEPTRPAVLFKISWWGNRRLKSATKKHTRILRGTDGATYKQAPRLAIMLDGKVIGVIPVKGEISGNTILMPFPLSMNGRKARPIAQRIVAGITGMPIIPQERSSYD